MFTFVLTVHFLLCAALIGLVLIQQGKGADMGAAFGAGSSNSLFGASGANNLVVKVTTFIAIAFMVTSIALINLSNSDSAIAASAASATSAPTQDLSGSVMDQATEPQKTAEEPVTGQPAAAPQATAETTAAVAPVEVKKD